MGGLRLAFATGVVLVGYGAWRLYNVMAQRSKQQELLNKYKKTMLPPVSQLRAIKADFIKEMEKGLADDDSKLMMLPSYVTQLPTGDEVGECYALDLGGTNFRVVYIKLSAKHGAVDEIDPYQVSIPAEVYTGTGEQLFDFLASTVKEFMETRAGGLTSPRLSNIPPVVGFCFSFPMQQQALDQGLLLDWTKGFSCEGVVGKDVVELLTEAFQRVGCPCRVAALLNDTVGVLAASRYEDQDAEVSIIIGTGTNACYVEHLSNIPKWQPAGVNPDTETVINIEWGSYDSPLLPYTEEDHVFDTISHSPGKYMFEKFIAGMCLGEVARLILLRFAREVALFGALVPAALELPGSFPTAALAGIEEDSTDELLETEQALESYLGVKGTSIDTRKMVQQICELVGQRSATMVATGLSAVLAKVGWEESPKRVSVTFDGGVYEKYAKYRHMLNDALCEILGERCAELKPLINLRHCQDYSALGGAVLAAAATRNSPAAPSA